jgi:glycine betaine transporter
MICGSESWRDIHDFGNTKIDFLRQYMKFENGIPSKSTIARFAWKIFTDTVSTLAIIFGISTSLGMGVLQIATGMNYVYGLPSQTTIGYFIILLSMTICFLFSAATGLKKGIKILSNINMILAGLLLFFVFLTGPTMHLLDTFVETIGRYLSNIIELSLVTGTLSPGYKEWVGEWPVTILAWTIAWSPFVGVFIARISKGRTLREVILGSLIVPTGFCMFWFSVFGGSVLHIVMNDPTTGLEQIILQDKTVAIFILLENLPWTAFTHFLSILLLFIFLVTSADSATFVVAMMTTEGDLDPGMKVKMLWGGIIATITLILLAGGGLEALQAASLVFAIPFSIVLIGVMISLYIRLSYQLSAPRI